MQDSMFQPPGLAAPRIAPTEIDPDHRAAAARRGARRHFALHGRRRRSRGTVHHRRRSGEIRANDARIAARRDGTRLFRRIDGREVHVARTRPPISPSCAGLGWDIDSPYSSNRGELFPIGSYGHTGFTGTSIWIDPASRTYVILLTNVVHPHRGKSLTSLRSRVATIVAASFGIDAPGVRLTGYNETITGPGLHRDGGTQGARF